VAEQHPGRIDLLVMPELGGHALAERVLALHPGMKVLYLSGHTADAVARHEQVHFLPKPFSPTALAQKVREVLDG
jgi:DNA-binding NtrC family response regulator